MADVQHIELPEIGVGMLGYAFMGKAHSNAFRKIAYMTWPPPFVPRLVALAGRNEEAVAAAAQRYGYERWTTDWRDIVGDPSASDSSTTAARTRCTPSRRSSPPRRASTSSARSRSGRTADESYDIWKRVAATGVKHMCGFNYRFVPAVRLAREMIEAGELGEIRHFRAPLPPGLGRRPDASTRGGSIRTRRAPARSAILRRTSSISRASSSASIQPSPRS